MDQTELFRATVKALRVRFKNQQKESNSTTDPGSTSSLLSRSTRKPTPFASEAKEVVGCISKLQQFLLQHRKDYINSAGHLASGASALSDSDRDQIDSDAQEFIKVCSERIKALQQEVAAIDVGEQTRQYRRAVHESLRDYLKRVCKLYSEQRAIRVKRIVERKRISRLQPEGYKRLLLSSAGKATEEPTSPGPDHTPDTPTTSTDPVASSAGTDGSSAVGVTTSATPDCQPEDSALPGSSGINLPARDPTRPSQPLVQASGHESGEGGGFVATAPMEGQDLSLEEKTEFERENEQLFEEVSTMVDEVRQIEGKVLEISRLQEIFTEKVLEQAKDLDIISDLTVEASENVVEGNEQVRGAIKNKASLRIWILFILIVCSFSLLFLDWYS